MVVVNWGWFAGAVELDTISGEAVTSIGALVGKIGCEGIGSSVLTGTDAIGAALSVGDTGPAGVIGVRGEQAPKVSTIRMINPAALLDMKHSLSLPLCESPASSVPLPEYIS
jgi:hypothetical protein